MGKKIIEMDCVDVSYLEAECVYGGWTALLSDRVNKKIKEGWQPYGAPIVHNGDFVSQFIVKYED